ncbi:HAMP domain-containing protein, partial [Campylobacter sp. LR185c]|uniref:HAMP domain-containing protein n=1 Tax=Campylobacter sp. LR185c TaxID=2014525 RepID=UPI00137D229B
MIYTRLQKWGGGFVNFNFTKPQKDGSNIIALKNSYAQMIPNTDDIWISTAIYIDTLGQKADTLIQPIENNMKSRFITSIVVAFICVLIIMVFVWIFQKKLILSIHILQNNASVFFDYLNNKTNKSQILPPATRDELGEIAHAINENIQNTKKSLEQDNLAVKKAISTVQVIESGDLTARIDANP